MKKRKYLVVIERAYLPAGLPDLGLPSYKTDLVEVHVLAPDEDEAAYLVHGWLRGKDYEGAATFIGGEPEEPKWSAGDTTLLRVNPKEQTY